MLTWNSTAGRSDCRSLVGQRDVRGVHMIAVHNVKMILHLPTWHVHWQHNVNLLQNIVSAMRFNNSAENKANNYTCFISSHCNVELTGAVMESRWCVGVSIWSINQNEPPWVLHWCERLLTTGCHDQCSSSILIRSYQGKKGKFIYTITIVPRLAKQSIS